MRSATDRLLPLGIAFALAACLGQPVPSTISPSQSQLASPSASTRASSTATESSSPSPTAGIALPTPGTPWDGAALLEEMRRSTRPDGVPPEVQTSMVADAIAGDIWTIDGATWDTIAIGGFCGHSTCTLDLAGTHIGRAGEDLWTVEVDLGTGETEPIVAEVRSLPWSLVDELDRLARTLDADLDPLVLTTVRWLPPPAEPGRFMLSYRSGGEEGSCAREVLLDAAGGDIADKSASNC